jgi:hypothetical protein
MGATFAEIRTAAFTLPGVVEGTSYGTPCLRVGKSMLARLREDGETLVLKVDHIEREILIEADPDVFFVTDHYLGYPWVLVRLPQADAAQIMALLRRAWFAAAPKRLRKGFDPHGGP